VRKLRYGEIKAKDNNLVNWDSRLAGLTANAVSLSIVFWSHVTHIIYTDPSWTNSLFNFSVDKIIAEHFSLFRFKVQTSLYIVYNSKYYVPVFHFKNMYKRKKYQTSPHTPIWIAQYNQNHISRTKRWCSTWDLKSKG